MLMLRPRTEEKKSLMPEACTGLKPVEEEEGEGEEGAHPTADGPTPTAYFGTNHPAGPGAAFVRSQFREEHNSSLFLMSRKNDKRGKCRGFYDCEKGRWLVIPLGYS